MDTPTVYELIRKAIDNNDNRFHRRMDAHWLRQYVTDASDYAILTEEEWEDLATCVRETVTRKKQEKIDAAVRVLEDSVNGSDKDLVVAAVGSMHRTLMDSLATAVMDAINQHTRSREGYFDGRIGTHFQKFILANWPDPFIGK